jgi:hypothetical protein
MLDHASMQRGQRHWIRHGVRRGFSPEEEAEELNLRLETRKREVSWWPLALPEGVRLREARLDTPLK